MSEQKLGSLITEGSGERDAIHVAIAPVVAAEDLSPGDHIGFPFGDTERVASSKRNPIAKPIGVVDPFLTGKVKRGERFFMVLYPKTITGLRHEWTHPAFPKADLDDVKAKSDAWMMNFAQKIGLSYWQLIRAANLYQETGGEATTRDPSGQFEYDIPDEFWHHWSVLTGIKPRTDGTPFSCCPD